MTKIHLKLPEAAVRARVVDGALVLGLRQATPPAVLRLSLDRLQAVSFEARELPEGWVIGLVAPKGEYTPAARFPDKDAADAAVEAVMRALLADRTGGAAILSRRFWTAMIIVGGLLAAFVSFSALMSGGSAQSGSEMATASGPTSTPIVPGSGPLPRGLPMPADQLLQRQ